MTYLQKSLNEGAMDIMINDAIAELNYFNYYKDYENRNPDIRIKRRCVNKP